MINRRLFELPGGLHRQHSSGLANDEYTPETSYDLMINRIAVDFSRNEDNFLGKRFHF